MPYPALTYVLVNYFHQDYKLDFGPVGETVDAFALHDPHLAPQVPDEIDALLSDATDGEVAAFVEGTGCAYLPPADLGYRGWLSGIADRLRARRHG